MRTYTITTTDPESGRLLSNILAALSVSDVQIKWSTTDTDIVVQKSATLTPVVQPSFTLYGRIGSPDGPRQIILPEDMTTAISTWYEYYNGRGHLLKLIPIWDKFEDRLERRNCERDRYYRLEWPAPYPWKTGALVSGTRCHADINMTLDLYGEEGVELVLQRCHEQRFFGEKIAGEAVWTHYVKVLVAEGVLKQS